MTAYVVVELTVQDHDAREKYSAGAGPTIKAFGGEFLVVGPWSVLTGDAAFTAGAIISFADRETAMRWYNSPEYQALIPLRDAALQSRFRVLGA
ncbi:DUF1330 domain-containing protein [Phenylobacterium sp.]|uniref:DUF1330 domain-containing protein n=1 Tax=Phenylobacterium sp. TaxID=1871053 RepID=UPI002F40E491